MAIERDTKTNRIPHDSNKRWLTLFYALPKEPVGKANGKRTQHIRIRCNGIGFIPILELMEQETA